MITSSFLADRREKKICHVNPGGIPAQSAKKICHVSRSQGPRKKICHVSRSQRCKKKYVTSATATVGL